jgi:hypothetical protein
MDVRIGALAVIPHRDFPDFLGTKNPGCWGTSNNTESNLMNEHKKTPGNQEKQKPSRSA